MARMLWDRRSGWIAYFVLKAWVMPKMLGITYRQPKKSGMQRNRAPGIASQNAGFAMGGPIREACVYVAP